MVSMHAPSPAGEWWRAVVARTSFWPPTQSDGGSSFHDFEVWNRPAGTERAAPNRPTRQPNVRQCPFLASSSLDPSARRLGGRPRAVTSLASPQHVWRHTVLATLLFPDVGEGAVWRHHGFRRNSSLRTGGRPPPAPPDRRTACWSASSSWCRRCSIQSMRRSCSVATWFGGEQVQWRLRLLLPVPSWSVRAGRRPARSRDPLAVESLVWPDAARAGVKCINSSVCPLGSFVSSTAGKIDAAERRSSLRVTSAEQDASDASRNYACAFLWLQLRCL